MSILFVITFLPKNNPPQWGDSLLTWDYSYHHLICKHQFSVLYQTVQKFDAVIFCAFLFLLVTEEETYIGLFMVNSYGVETIVASIIE